jgi:predicted methyltransferase
LLTEALFDLILKTVSVKVSNACPRIFKSRAGSYTARSEIRKEVKVVNHSTCTNKFCGPGCYLLVLVAVLGLLACSNVSTTALKAGDPQNLTKAQIAAIIDSPDRTAADRTNDLRRKPAQMLDFIGIRPGLTALDLSTGGGYTTELLARAVGPAGRVYGQSQPPRAADAPARPAVTPEGNSAPQLTTTPIAQSSPPVVRRTSAQALAERAKNASLPNLFSVVRVFEDPVLPELSGQLELVTLMFNYHDLGHMGVDRARMNAAVFAGMKSGGIYVIADHAGRPGTGISEAGTLHRIEEAFLRKEVEAAGFRFLEHADFLRNPADPRDRNTPEPAQPKDEFVLKFVKP